LWTDYKPRQETNIPDTTHSHTKALRERQQQVKADGVIDSLRLNIALQDAFKIAETAFGTGDFTRQYELKPDDSSYTINMEILIGRLFQNDQEYFLLSRHVPWASYIDLYKVVDNKVEKQISREQGGMTYVRDSIFDANGDGHKDFAVHWYPSSGCCRRNIYNVYLKLTSSDQFSSDYEFINPTFSAKDKIIRGVEYGHPGKVGLYKYRWKGLGVDTIEFIYPDLLVKGQFIKTRKKANGPIKEEGIALKEIPKEYHSIESYEWFVNF